MAAPLLPLAGGRNARAGAQPKMIPLHTTASRYPWYFTRAPVGLPLPGGPLGTSTTGGDVDAVTGAATAALGGATAAANQQPQPGLPPAGPGRMGLPLPARPPAQPAAAQQQQQASEARQFFRYRYAVYRAGVFHRWERPGDGPADGDAMMTTADDDGGAASAAASSVRK